MNTIHVVGLIGYLVCGVSYIMLIRRALSSIETTFGMVLVTIGYLLLGVGIAYGDGDGEVIRSINNSPKDSENDRKPYITIIGSMCLAIFFVGIHINPMLTFHLRQYDIFAAVGYLAKTMVAPTILVNMALVLYYVLGAYAKLHEEDAVSFVQLIGRTMLAVYYGVTV